jgi:DNA repair protein RadA/Sms
MAKDLKLFFCSKCDAQFSKWSGRCPDCGGWGTVTESQTSGSGPTANTVKPALIIQGTKIGKAADIHRLQTKISELDRVFGGGLVPGSLVLLGGEPGIGKSTITAQIAQALPADKSVVYASGEESIEQISLRLERLGCQLERLSFINSTDIEAAIAALVSQPPALLIIDSIQTMHSSSEPGAAGSVSQIRAVAVKLLEFAKSQQTAVIIIGHITKDGSIAGPKTLEHLVDTVIYLECDASQSYRLLRTTKNRFGSTNEIGIFEMTGAGLQAVANPASLFLEANQSASSGSVLAAVLEGTRPFLVEVQALTNKTVFGYPQRRSSGFDTNRLQVLAAVLMKRARLNVSAHDIILNVVGGLKIEDPGLDLAVCLAIAGSLLDKAHSRQTIVVGEVGLGGEVRPVPRLESKLREAAKLGFTTAITPVTDLKIPGLEIKMVKNVSQALTLF